MTDPNSDHTIQSRRNRPGSPPNGNGAAQAPNGSPDGDATMVPQTKRAGSSGALPAFFGTLAALIVFGLIGVGGYFAYHALTAPSSTSANAAPVAHEGPAPQEANPLSDPAKWTAGTEVAQTLSGDASPDIGWWVRTFDLPKEEGRITSYLKNEGVDATSVVPLHYEDTPQATTITYQVKGTIPEELLRVPKATWAPSDPELKPFASAIVLNHDLPAGQFWNTTEQSVARPAGTTVDVAWKVSLDKSTHVVTADQLSTTDGGVTPQQVAQYETETNDAVNQLKAQVAAIDARVQADTQAKLAQVPADPLKPELMSTKWNHGDGSGEPTKSAERMGGGTAAGAAGGAAFGAVAGDAGMGAGIGAGVGLLGGFIYDTVSKNNDRERYERRAKAENAERMDNWRSQVKALAKQRDQIKKDAVTERDQQIQDLLNRLNTAGGRVDALPTDTPQTVPAPSETPVTPAQEPASGPVPNDSSPNQPSGPVR